MSEPTIHVAARMRLGLQKCRLCGERLGRDWSEDDVPLKDVPRFKPGTRVVMIWDPPYRSIWTDRSYPEKKHGPAVKCRAGVSDA